MIDCAVAGDVHACRRMVAELERQGRKLALAESEVSYALDKSRGVWAGEAATRFREFARGVLDSTEELRQRTFLFADELERFAAAIDGVRHTMTDAVEFARHNGLPVIGDQIHESASGMAVAFQSAPGSQFVAPPAPYTQCESKGKFW